MNRTRFILLGLFAMVVAGLVSLKIAGIVRRTMATASEAQVVVAARDLNVGQLITDSDLRMVAMSSAVLPHGSFTIWRRS